ncbi:MAG TPA: zinc carboxypeptidase, partial [Actinophytocola sp.]|nr:zinc carboxypeptidase [Actinophytocola sp.]
MNRKRFSLVAGAIVALATALSLNTTVATGDQPDSRARDSAEYSVLGVKTAEQRSAIAATGAAINGPEDSRLMITATPDEVRRIQALGYTVI